MTTKNEERPMLYWYRIDRNNTRLKVGETSTEGELLTSGYTMREMIINFAKRPNCPDEEYYELFDILLDLYRSLIITQWEDRLRSNPSDLDVWRPDPREDERAMPILAEALTLQYQKSRKLPPV